MNIYLLTDSKYSYLLANRWANEVLEDFNRDSYILNIEGLIRNPLNGTRTEQYIYLDLLSIRNVFTYYNTKGRAIFLPIWQIKKKYDIDKLKANRLLNIDKYNIHFVYEEEI